VREKEMTEKGNREILKNCATVNNLPPNQILEAAAKEFNIFIDTCNLLCDEADSFWENIVDYLEREDKKAIIPYKMFEELNRFVDEPALCAQEYPNSPNFNATAKKVKKDLLRLYKAGLVEIYIDKPDDPGENAFLTILSNYKLKYDHKYNLTLTNKKGNFASDIINIGMRKIEETKNTLIIPYIKKYSESSVSEETSTSEKLAEETPADTAVMPAEEKFALSKEIAKVNGNITVSKIPHAGDTVIAERRGNFREIKLTKAFASGGEGTIYHTNMPNFVAKIYGKNQINKIKYEKIKLMLTKNIICRGICFPVASLYNTRNEFVGFLMPKARGKELQKCVFIPPLLKKNFPNWKKRDTVQLCITILKKIKYLHDKNIILGDINPNNILVVSPKEVYFVDTDSFQIEGFPCPVGTTNFTAPEIQRKKYDSFLRTMGNDQFAVATLLFMIMLPGKPPYSVQGGENQSENIINMDFAYGLGEESNGRTPDGPWKFCWSHLPCKLKEAFYQTFKKGEEHSTENTRYSSEDWLQLFKGFLSLLESKNFADQDEMSNELFPLSLRKNKKETYVKCLLCNVEVGENSIMQGYCRECLKKGETYECSRCGCKLVLSNYQKLIQQSKRNNFCKACNIRKNSTYTQVQTKVPHL
jgi:serine/threonine protein kinase